MGSGNISKTTITDLTNGVKEITIDQKPLDYVSVGQDETYWYFSDAAKNYGYYKDDAALKSGMDTLANYTCGRGWSCPESKEQEEILKLIKGNGKDSFDSIMWNHDVVKNTVGDAFAEIVRAEKSNPKSILINLRPISPERVRLVLKPDGMIKRYDVLVNGEWKPIQKEFIFHSSNGRIADEIHGTSRIESLKWIIDARKECLMDLRKVVHRSTIRVIYVDVTNTDKLNELKIQYKEGIDKHEVLILPGKKGDVEIVDYATPDVTAYLAFINYLENFFYQVLGIPKAVMGGTVAVSEGNSKVGILSWEQVYETEQRFLEMDILNQLNIKVVFDKPESIMPNMQQNEAKNTSQTGFQPKDTAITEGRE